MAQPQPYVNGIAASPTRPPASPAEKEAVRERCFLRAFLAAAIEAGHLTSEEALQALRAA
jgi:uncharacterized membrane protein YebE (DUF533 family)